jgi:hypothetical protein
MPPGIQRFIASLALLILGTIIAWNANGRSWIGVDDAQIYLVYMQHLAEGHGFVYTVGGESVEGFTSLLWTLIGGLIATLRLPLEFSLLAFNVLLNAFLLSRLWGFQNKERFISPASMLFLGLIFFTPGYIEWTILSLLETGLWTFLLGMITLGILERTSIRYMSVLIALLILCRPEAMLWGFALSMLYAFAKWKDDARSKAAHFIPVMIVIFTLGCLVFWRISYFGYPLPNTYYAKVSSDVISNLFDGMKYTAKAMLQIPMLIPIIGLIIIHALLSMKKSGLKNMESDDIVFVIIASITVLIPLLTGGDHFQLSRFYQATLPLMILGAVQYVSIPKAKRQLFTIGIILIAMISSRWILYAMTQTPLAHEWKIAIEGRNQSEQLNAFFSNDALPSQGVLTAGGTAFSYRGETIDLLGLNNVRMAHAVAVKKDGLMKNHASFVPEVFYEQSPDIVWMGGGFSEKEKTMLNIPTFTAKIFHDIHREKRFEELYGAFCIRNHEGIYMTSIMKKTFVNGLNTQKYYIKGISIQEIP